MKVSNVNTMSFKGIYLLKGNEEVLDEICWFMQRKQKNSDNSFEFLDIRNGFYVPRSVTAQNKESLDLFITENTKKIIEPKMGDLVTQSLEQSIMTLPFNEKVKRLLTNLNEMREAVSHGKPVLGLKPNVVSDYIRTCLNLERIQLNSAECAFEGIKKGSFDIVEGLIKSV